MKNRFLPAVIAALLWPAAIHASPNFTREAGVRVSSGIPYSVEGASAPYRLYFTRDLFQIVSATSSDGLNWTQESGVRVSSETIPILIFGSFTYTGASVLKLTSGGYRMVYSAATSTSGWVIANATSTDGLAWANQGLIFTSSATFIGNPQVVKLVDGNWRMYFLRDSNGGDDVADRQVLTSLSTDQGATWSAVTLALTSPASGLSAVVRSDDRPRLYLTRPLTQETTSSVVISVLASSSQGSTFDVESGTRLSTASSSGSLNSAVVFSSTDSVRWRMLFGFNLFPSTLSNILSATTQDPDPQALSPSQVVRTAPATAFTISGEVFESTPTVALTRSGETDISGTSLIYNSDLSVTATFDTSNRAIGYWNLTMTNPAGHQTVLANALLITFLSGNLVLTDNLLRPRTGARTRIDVQIFDGGQVELSVYTLDGQLVNSLYRDQTPIGTLTRYWDGTTGDGNPVASGVYFIKATGPKLDEKEKVVVIR